MSNKSKFWQKGEFYFIVLLFIITLYFVVTALGFPRMAKIFPMVVGTAALLIITADVLQLTIPKLGQKFSGFKGGEIFKTEKEDELTKEFREKGEGDTVDEEGGESVTESETSLIIKTFFWFMGGFAVFYYFGYLVFAVAFLFFFLKLYAHLSFIRSFILTACFTLFVWLAFSLFLKLDIFAGSSLF